MARSTNAASLRKFCAGSVVHAGREVTPTIGDPRSPGSADVSGAGREMICANSGSYSGIATIGWMVGMGDGGR